MATNAILAIGVGMALVALVMSGYGARRQARNEELNKTLLQKFNGSVAELAQMKDLLATATMEVARLRPALDAALTEIVRLRAALDLANGELAQLRATIATKVPHLRPLKPLLLAQCEPAFGDTDAIAIRRTGIPFQRRAKCTAEDFDNALQTGREDGLIPPYVQISAHANESHIKFFDREVTIEWLSQRIRGIQVLFLAGCETNTIGDQLVAPNTAQHVITMMEPVENRDAGNFTFAFWRAVGDGVTAPEAFEQALGICPQSSEFVQMRSARERRR